MGIAAYVTFNSFDGIKKKKRFELLFLGTVRKWNRIRKTKFINRTRIKLSEFYNILNPFRPDILSCSNLLVKVLGERERERGRRRSEEAPLRDKKKVMGFGV